MKVCLAESAGFCYGVRRAVELARETAVETRRCWMLGDLIHNANVVEELKSIGTDGEGNPAHGFIAFCGGEVASDVWHGGKFGMERKFINAAERKRD